MEDKAQSKAQIPEKYIFHFCLIKLLVLEELRKINRDLNTFLFLSNYDPKIMVTPSNRISHVMKEKETLAELSKKRERHRETM